MATSQSLFSGPSRTRVASGRYLVFHAGQECGEERWRIELSSDGLVASGEQELVAPHPFPNRQQYRASLTSTMRIRGLEVHWTVGTRTLRAEHAAEAGTWRVRVEAEGHAREQSGDFPDACEVEYGTHLFNTFILARRDFQLEGEHEFPVLRIGPPLMAVSPERMLYRCVEVGTFAGPVGPVRAKRYVVSLPPRGPDDGYAFWADDDGFVLESYEGLDPSRPWMRLVEYRHG
jgi:Putative glycolipid-binding